MRTSGNLYTKFVRGNSYRAIFIPFGLILLCLIIYIGRLENNSFVKDLRAKSVNIIYSATSSISSPINLIKDGFKGISELRSLYEENTRYKELQLLDSSSFQELIALKLRIAQYEELLNVSKDIEFDFETSRIVGDYSNNYNSSLIISAGENEGIEIDTPVAGYNGIIGRISNVSKTISRVLLLNNVNSRIPVSISENGYQGILVGQGSKNPTVEYLDNIEKIIIGDLVFTSGKGSIFPPFQLVGQVANKKNNRLEIEVFEDIKSLSHVRLLNYNIDDES